MNQLNESIKKTYLLNGRKYLQIIYNKGLISIKSTSFPGGSNGKVSACNAGDPGLIPWLGRSSTEGNGNPLQYSCLENSMDGRTWEVTVYGVTKN